MEEMGKQCTLPDVKEKHQDALLELETYLAEREPNETGKKLISLSIRVEVVKGCIKTREERLGIGAERTQR